MSNPDYRALCSELAQELVNEYGYCTEWEKGLPLCESNVSELLNRARAALAQPEPVAPTDEELPMPAAIRDMPEQQQRWYALGWRAALARHGTPTIQPVSVSERLPEPEDCDAEGRCWWWHPAHIEDDFDNDWVLLNHEWAGLVLRDSDNSPIYTHWLPANALPTPEANQ